MAKPYQKNGRWYVRFKDARGAWRDKATGARTKSEARRLQLELERKAERQRLGLEALPSDAPEMTFGTAMDLWWSEHGRRLRSHTIRRFMEKHLRAELGPLPLSQVGPRLESVLNAKVGVLGPESLNHLRAAVHRVFAFLTRRGAWKGATPAFAIPRFKVPKRLPQYLRLEEVRLLLAALDAQWRGLFATSVYLGLRRGEVIALRKSDVDLEARTIRIGRSGVADTTKGGHEDLLPLPDELVPWIEHAMGELAVGRPVSARQRKAARARRATAGRSPPRAGACRDRERQGPQVPTEGLRLLRAPPVRRAGPVPELPDAALAGGRAQAAPLPRPTALDRDAAPEGRRPARDRPADPPAHRPEDHLRGLRPPRH